MSADDLYIDPSALRALYVHDPVSRKMAAWRGRLRGALALTRFGWAELVNAVALGCFRGDYPELEMNRSLAHIEEDFADGDLKLVDLLWRATMDRAMDLSRRHSPETGTRALDVLHVASALELQAHGLVMYDTRQARLARLCGLKVITP